MGIKSALSKPFAQTVIRGVNKWSRAPFATQQKVFKNLMLNAQDTHFGTDHGFKKIRSYSDFKVAVPIRDYEALKPYVNRMVEGEPDVLWKGRPIYLSKTSGTTSGAKYIPITQDSISHHIHNARNAILFHINNTKDASFVNGKMIFLSGSPELGELNGIPLGRLSGIVNHHVPDYLRKNQLPSYKTNIIEDWEKKVDAIVEETINEDMRLISGIPSWVQMYFERVLEKSGKQTIREVFPKL